VQVSNVTGSRLRIDTGSGGVSGDGLGVADLFVDVGSGGIRLEDVRSERARVESGSGSITLRMGSSPRSLDVQTGSGGVTLYLPPALSADVEIETGSGGIDSDFPIQMNRWERNHVRGRIGEGAGRIRVETGSGGVRLRKG